MRPLDVCTLALVLGACLQNPAAPPANSQSSEHLWVFHIAGGPYAAHIQLVAIGDGADEQRSREFRPIPSRAWDGALTNDFAYLTATPADYFGRSWMLRHPDGRADLLAYTITGDTAIGSLTLEDGTRYPVFGVRFDTTMLNLVASALPSLPYDSKSTVLIRLDDAFTTDRDFVERLEARGLVAEIAVPTRLVGRPGHLQWDELQRWRSEGMGIVMHSRYHKQTGADAQEFIAEVVGGFADMAAHGLATNIFVEPGSWRDSILFDSPAKIHTWRGALLRTFATVSECYVYGSNYSVARSDTFALGLAHATISDGAHDTWIRAAWQLALRPNHVTVFLVHTFRLQSPDQLDWFLNLVADANTKGTIRIAAGSQDLLFRSPTEPATSARANRLRLGSHHIAN
jgi:hypothetical protein